MRRTAAPALLCLIIAIALAACTSAEEKRSAEVTEIAASIFATQTAEAPTATPTPTVTPTWTPTPTFTPAPTWTPTPEPTDTPVPSPTPTSEPASTARPSPVAAPLEEGWVEYDTGEFRVALPEQWEVIDVGQEGIEAILGLMENLDSEWAQSISGMITAEAMQEALRMWAMDPEPAGIGFATVNVSYQQQPFSMRTNMLIIQLEAAYEQMGFEVVSSDSGLEINGLDAGRIGIRLTMGPFGIQQYQVLYVRDTDLWIVTMAVDENVWETYEPIFAEIAESFRLD